MIRCRLDETSDRGAGFRSGAHHSSAGGHVLRSFANSCCPHPGQTGHHIHGVRGDDQHGVRRGGTHLWNNLAEYGGVPIQQSKEGFAWSLCHAATEQDDPGPRQVFTVPGGNAGRR